VLVNFSCLVKRTGSTPGFYCRRMRIEQDIKLDVSILGGRFFSPREIYRWAWLCGLFFSFSISMVSICV